MDEAVNVLKGFFKWPSTKKEMQKVPDFVKKAEARKKEIKDDLDESAKELKELTATINGEVGWFLEVHHPSEDCSCAEEKGA